MKNKIRHLPPELGSSGGFGQMIASGPPHELQKPTPEMEARMARDAVLKEERKPLAAMFQQGVYEGMSYRFYVPENLDAEKRYPLVLFLHGGGERGDDNEAQLTAYEGALVWVRDQMNGGEPCFVLAPQCPAAENCYWLEPELIKVSEILSELMDTHPIDKNRLYLTGMSMGGGGCWRMNYMFLDMFAAVVPICSAGGTKGRVADPVAIGQAADGFLNKNLWLFHAEDDFVVTPETSRSLVAALEQRGKVCGVDFFYTEYPAAYGYNHGSWTPAYENAIMRKWLFQQTLAPAMPFGPPPGPDGGPMEPPPEMRDAFARQAELTAIRMRDYVPRFEAGAKGVHGITVNYRLFVPEHGNKKCPMVVVLHGIGECGVNNTEPLTANDGVLDWVKHQDSGLLEPCVVLAPQSPLPVPNLCWEEAYLSIVNEIISELCQNQPVDEDRIYVAGLSLGGYGAWNISRLFPERFAAVVSCCPACLEGTMFDNHISDAGLARCSVHLQNKPLWMFHAEDDPAVPVVITKTMAKNLETANGTGEHHVTIYPASMKLGHGSWEKAFKDQEMLTWLMEQRRGIS